MKKLIRKVRLMAEICEEEKEVVEICEKSSSRPKWNVTNEELVLLRHDFIVLRLLLVCSLTFCLVIFLVHVTNRDRNSYELLQDILEEMETLNVDEVYIPRDWTKILEASDHWSWDSEMEILKVNTSIFVS